MVEAQTAARSRGRPKKGMEHDADALFDAAVACFAEHGFDKTSLRMIAVRAGVDVALISYRYGSKLGLWTAVVDAVAEESLSRISAWPEEHASQPHNEKLKQLCRDMVKLIEKRPLFSIILTSEMMQPSDTERKDLIADRLARPVSDRIAHYVEELAAESRATLPDNHQLNLLLAVAMIGFATSTRTFIAKLTGRSLDSDSLSQQLENMMMRLIV